MSSRLRKNSRTSRVSKKLGVLLPLVFFCCGEPQNANIKDKDSITITGSFADDTDISEYFKYNISKDGVQTAPIDYSAETHFFSFTLSLNTLIKTDELGVIDRITSMGRNNVPTDFAPGDFAQKPLGFGRMQIWGDMNNENQTLSLYDGLIPVSRSSILSAKDSFALGQVYLAAAGFADVTVVASDGSPIEGASVAIINLDSTRPIRLWDEQNFPPSFVLTNDLGKAAPYGINTSGNEPNFQVVAFKDGYCPYLSFPRVYDAQVYQEFSITLNACSENRPLAGELRAFFADEVNTLSMQDDAFGTADVAQISATEVTLRLDPQNLDLRPLTFNIYEGYETTGSVLTQKVLNTFSSEITLDIPALFSNNSANGTFTIEIISRRNELDYSQGEVKPYLLYGKKYTIKPILLNALFTVSNQFASENIISGRSGVSFKVEVKNCGEGESIAILDELQVDTSKVNFFSCSAAGLVTIPGDSIGYDLEATGSKRLKFFIKDIFGNISEDDPVNKENRRTVYVDFSPPDIDLNPLVVGKKINNLGEFGFAPKTAAKGTNAQAYIFDNTLFITPATISDFVLRFSKPSKCLLLEPGGGGDGSDNRIAWFDIAGTEESPDPTNAGALCGDDLTFNAGDILFPSSSSENATLRLQVFDAAANISEPVLYTVAPCPVSGGIFEFCWKENE